MCNDYPLNVFDNSFQHLERLFKILMNHYNNN